MSRNVFQAPEELNIVNQYTKSDRLGINFNENQILYWDNFYKNYGVDLNPAYEQQGGFFHPVSREEITDGNLLFVSDCIKNEDRRKEWKEGGFTHQLDKHLTNYATYYLRVGFLCNGQLITASEHSGITIRNLSQKQYEFIWEFRR